VRGDAPRGDELTGAGDVARGTLPSWHDAFHGHRAIVGRVTARTSERTPAARTAQVTVLGAGTVTEAAEEPVREAPRRGQQEGGVDDPLGVAWLVRTLWSMLSNAWSMADQTEIARADAMRTAVRRIEGVTLARPGTGAA